MGKYYQSNFRRQKANSPIIISKIEKIIEELLSKSHPEVFLEQFYYTSKK